MAVSRRVRCAAPVAITLGAITLAAMTLVTFVSGGAGAASADDNPWRRVYSGASASPRGGDAGVRDDYAPVEPEGVRPSVAPATSASLMPGSVPGSVPDPMMERAPMMAAPAAVTGGGGNYFPAPDDVSARMDVPQGQDVSPGLQAGYAYPPPPTGGYAPPPDGAPAEWGYAPAFDPYSRPGAAPSTAY